MKKVLFFAILLTFSLKFTSSKASEITLRVYDNSIFNLTFNNEVFYNIPGSISLKNLSPGKHYVKVHKFRTKPNGYTVGMPRLLFEGMIHIPAGMIISAVFDRYGRYLIEQEVIVNYYQPEPPVYIPPYMDERDFLDLKSTIAYQSFESTKLSIAKQVTSANILTSRQVFEIMELFTFESTKLDFAKFAYKYVFDPNKYYIVNNAFTFSSSISSLNNYIASFY